MNAHLMIMEVNDALMMIMEWCWLDDDGGYVAPDDDGGDDDE